MKPTRRPSYLAAALCAASSFATALVGAADAAWLAAPDSVPNVYNNFGFPMGFDVSKMDKSANPRQDSRVASPPSGRTSSRLLSPHPRGGGGCCVRITPWRC